MNRRVAGAVLLYHAPADCEDNVGSYLDDLAVLYVVDNSPGGHLADLSGLLSRREVVHLPQPDNAGVAEGLNIAVRRALRDGYEWLLAMDQDSRARPNMLALMLDALATTDRHDIGLVCPVHRGLAGTPPAAAAAAETVRSAMTTGSLIHLETCRRLGMFDADLFVDGVDHEYCLRLRRHGCEILRANAAILDHEPGRPTTAWFGRVVISNHAPLRRYYKVRNRFGIARGHGIPRALCFVVSAMEAVLILLHESERAQKLRMMLRGFADYRRNRWGPFRL